MSYHVKAFTIEYFGSYFDKLCQSIDSRPMVVVVVVQARIVFFFFPFFFFSN